MTNRIKVLSLALVAVAALSAMAASIAHAGKLHIGAQPAVLTAHSEAGQEHTFTVQSTSGANSLKLKCNTASFEGTTQGQTIEEATVTPTFGQGQGDSTQAQGCSKNGIKAQVLMNGCKYTFTGAGQPAHRYLLDIVGCTEGKQIEIVTPLCTLRIPQQNGLGSTETKQLNAQEVTVQMNVSGIIVQQAGGFACPDGAAPHTGTKGSLTGNTILKAFKDQETKQVTKHQHQYTEHICGFQVAIQAT